MTVVRVCFVCLGNICRSPTAEGIMRALVREAGLDGAVAVESAGTSAYHVGEPADARSRQVAAARGVVLDGRSRRFEAGDFERLDHVVAMDRENREDLLALAPGGAARAKVSLLRAFDPAAVRGARGLDVPDPYGGGPRGFDDVFELIEAACRGLLDHLTAERDPAG